MLEHIEIIRIINSDICTKYIETYIRAIEKLVIKDVVNWKNKMLDKNKEVKND